jgi:cytochrome bd ubiquinol oxidase subunit I
VRPVRLAFEFMVGAGMALAGLSVIGLALAWRRKALPRDPWFLRAVAAAGPLGFLAIEAGWVVTEVGRQPWVIQGFMRTADAVTPVPGLVVPLVAFTGLYLLLAGTVLALLRQLVFLEPAP